ncbi:heme exporter protein B, CycW [Candidatus Photodesmus katoptron Akat1]|uniref:Heme exporter protein B, CycW n=1 Tax=Candidatus Photodesmus katoptron Akat1 TaxID=1236703 RepID=S3DGV4_9GAMM|nr:heme exporter protein B, CycW [Candidatus Photodesmus katoptron Akat1]
MCALIRREFFIIFHRKIDILNHLYFFIIIIVLFPLSFSPELLLLSHTIAGVVWISVLLSIFLSLERLFRDDFLDGSLEQIMLTPIPLPLIIIIKVMAHWIWSSLPLVLISPLLLVFFQLIITFGLLLF